MDGTSLPRPQHQRHGSSKTGILKSLVSLSKTHSSGADNKDELSQYHSSASAVPVLPPDHPHGRIGRVLGERQGNAQTPSSPTRENQMSQQEKTRDGRKSADVKKLANEQTPSRSVKNAANLPAVFAKINRSSKNISTVSPQKEKENTVPSATASTRVETPIWAQFATTNTSRSRPSTSDSSASNNVYDLIAKYTPQDYAPGKQRNWNDMQSPPCLRPTLSKPRPQSEYSVLGPGGAMNAIARRVSGGGISLGARRSEDGTELNPNESLRKLSDRRGSTASTDHHPPDERLDAVKKGGRVMAAVAALQEKVNQTADRNIKPELDEQAINAAFETLLDARNIPEAQRERMRTLTLRIKADFVKQDRGQAKNVDLPLSEPLGADMATSTATRSGRPAQDTSTSAEGGEKSTKRSRSRSRTFTFSRSDKTGEGSPSKKQRSRSRTRPNSIHIPRDNVAQDPATSAPATPVGSLGRRSAPPAVPADYISYLRNNPDPTKVEVGRLHKLRILLRNETVAWVDKFVSLGGMVEITSLLKRTMAIEWREEHEDQLLHENLLCLKGICTTERAVNELDKLADDLFPALIGMLFDDENKGPAEYATRVIIMNVLFNFLASATGSSPSDLEKRARRILAYLGERPKPDDPRPVEFILDMRVPRPYKLWNREVTNVTREVFWIFLHQQNVVSFPKPGSSDGHPPSSAHSGSSGLSTASAEPDHGFASTYTHRHFPGSRPPVPAAPYIGGVEWDATTYMTAHLDLLNGIIASIPTAAARNELRRALQASGFEKVMGGQLRTCKEKFYAGVHDALRAWVAAAVEDGWDAKFVREGPTEEELGEKAVKAWNNSPKKSPKKQSDEPPKLGALPAFEHGPLELHLGNAPAVGDVSDDGWLA